MISYVKIKVYEECVGTNKCIGCETILRNGHKLQVLSGESIIKDTGNTCDIIDTIHNSDISVNTDISDTTDTSNTSYSTDNSDISDTTDTSNTGDSTDNRYISDTNDSVKAAAQKLDTYEVAYKGVYFRNFMHKIHRDTERKVKIHSGKRTFIMATVV